MLWILWQFNLSIKHSETLLHFQLHITAPQQEMDRSVRWALRCPENWPTCKLNQWLIELHLIHTFTSSPSNKSNSGQSQQFTGCRLIWMWTRLFCNNCADYTSWTVALRCHQNGWDDKQNDSWRVHRELHLCRRRGQWVFVGESLRLRLRFGI